MALLKIFDLTINNKNGEENDVFIYDLTTNAIFN